MTLGNSAAPIIKPEFQTQFQTTLSKQQTPQQVQQLQQMKQETMKQAQKVLYMQKYKEAKHLAHQVQEESFQSQESDEEEYGEDQLYGDEDNNEELKVDLKSAIIEVPKANVKKGAFVYGKQPSTSQLNASASNEAPAEEKKKKSGLSSKIAGAFKKLF